jgi:hypothetical protein
LFINGDEPMDPKVFTKFELPFQLEQLSKFDGGLYFFSIRFPTDYELGITTGVKSNIIVQNIATRLDKYARAYAYCELKGSLIDSRAEHMRTRFDIDGKFVICTKPSELLHAFLAQVTHDLPLSEITSALRFAFSAEIPVYIGICHDQSFYDRISQHVSGHTGLHPFLKECQMNLTDLSVHCLPLHLPDRSRLRGYERIVQAVFRPAFSLT